MVSCAASVQSFFALFLSAFVLSVFDVRLRCVYVLRQSKYRDICRVEELAYLVHALRPLVLFDLVEQEEKVAERLQCSRFHYYSFCLLKRFERFVYAVQLFAKACSLMLCLCLHPDLLFQFARLR